MYADRIKDLYQEKALFFGRTAIAAVLCLGLTGLLIWRLYDLQVLQQAYYATRAEANRVREAPIAPVRGLIYDRNGRVLAQNAPAFVLELVPEQVKDIDAVLARLGRVIPVSDSEIARFRERMRGTPRYRPVAIRSNLSMDEVARFELEKHDFPGLEVNATLTRSYPLGAHASHVIGYVGGINEEDLSARPEGTFDGLSQIGKTGVERAQEDILRGDPGERLFEANAYGRPLRELESEPGQGGQSLVLGLDVRLQEVAENALGELTGAVVAIDPRNGEVLALVSKPGFDPELFVEGIDQKNYNALLADPNRPLYNRALAGTYPPGSTVKPFMALAALENDVIDSSHAEFCGGQMTLPGSSHKYRCWKRSGHGTLDMVGGLMHSCDIYFYRVAVMLGVDRIHNFLDPFGLGHPTGIDLPLERAGILPSSEWKRRTRNQPWYPGETLSVGIGQGYMTVTPIQLAQITARMAMRGKGFQPHLVIAHQDPLTGLTTPEPTQPMVPISHRQADGWEKVIDAMRSVNRVPGGTGYRVFGKAPYESAGKSGTAQVAALSQKDLRARKIEDTPYELRDHALFIAFAPVEEPQIAVAVIAEHAGGGSSVAGPIARQVIDMALLGEVQYQVAAPKR